MIRILLLIVSFIAIILSVVIPGKSNGISSAFSGADTLSLFSNTKERGFDKYMTIAMTSVTALYFVLIILERVTA